VIILFLERKGDKVPIIEEVVKVIVKNKKVITLLLKRKGDKVPIIKEIMV
jgi:glycerol-3-phosphate dehydrogenase